MPLSDLLEDFDAGKDEPPTPVDGPLPGYGEGYATGHAAGLAEARAEQGRISAEAAQTLADLAFTQAEARVELLASLGPLFKALIDQVLPDAIRDMTGPRVVEALRRAAEADLALPIRIHAPEDEAPGLAAIVAAQAGLSAEVLPDPALGAGQIVIDGPGGETGFDAEALLDTLREALRALLHPEDDFERKASDG